MRLFVPDLRDWQIVAGCDYSRFGNVPRDPCCVFRNQAKSMQYNIPNHNIPGSPHHGNELARLSSIEYRLQYVSGKEMGIL